MKKTNVTKKMYEITFTPKINMKAMPEFQQKMFSKGKQYTLTKRLSQKEKVILRRAPWYKKISIKLFKVKA